MTRRATFGGEAVVPLPDGDVLRGAMDDRGHLRVQREDGFGALVWEADLGDLGEDPSLRYADSQTSDYGCLYWATTDTLVLLGDATALVLGAANGAVTTSYELKPVGRPSLEVSGVSALPGADGVVIASARRVWVIGSDLQPVVCVDADSLLASFPRLEQGFLVVDEYDFDGEQGEVRARRFPLAHGVGQSG
ncbi:hypothetical protein ACQEV2_24590 [Streptomyces sp. CA-251387]|uniref:hypothetical protein n=1 Tax=Streptomyces sp. CA-251387 TaxID=3240064 RepID=UPI003D910EBB